MQFMHPLCPDQCVGTTLMVTRRPAVRATRVAGRGGRPAESRVRRRSTRADRCPRRRSRRRPRHDHERHGPEDGDGAQLGQEAGQLLVEERGHPRNGAPVREGGIERVPGEDPDDGQEAGDDRLHDEIAAAPECGQALGARELRQDRCPQHEARGEHDQLQEGTSDDRVRGEAHGAHGQRPHRHDGDDGHGGQRADRHAQDRVDGRRPGQAGDERTRCPQDQERWHGEGQQQPLEHEGEEQPMAGQVGQWPRQGTRGEDDATEEEELLSWRRAPALSPGRPQVTGDQAQQDEQPQQVEMPVEGTGGGDHGPAPAVGSGRWRPLRSSTGWSASPIWCSCCSTRASR